MKKVCFFLLSCLFAFTISATNLPPEKIYPLTQVQRTLDYYKKQHDAWKKVLNEHPTDANAWLNYYTAGHCANSMSSTNTYNLQAIVDDMIKSLPEDKFEYHYIQAWNNGRESSDYFQHITNAYEIDPDRHEIYDQFIAYHEILGEQDQVDFYCKKWLDSGAYSPGMLSWNYNALMSVETNGLLLTYGDNTTYPVWLLQYGKGLRPDVITANLSLLTSQSYRNTLFNKLNIPDLSIGKPQNSVEEEGFYGTLIDHILKHASNPVYISMASLRQLRERYSENLYIVGLALKYSDTQIDNIAMLRNNYENRFLTDYLKVDLSPDISSSVLNFMNLNYIPPFILLYRHYTESGESSQAAELKNIIGSIAEKGGKSAEVAQYFPEEKVSDPITSDISIKDLDKNMMPISNRLYAAATETSNGDYMQVLVDLAKNRNFDQLNECRINKTDWKSQLPESFQDVADKILSKDGNPDANLDGPIQNISHEAAIVYCDWLTTVYNQSDYKKKRFKKVKFRLPTQEEWHLAATGGHIAAPYPWGGYYCKNAKGCYLANFNVTEEPPCEDCDYIAPANDGGFFTVNVDAYFPNDYGLYNISGNVAEMITEGGKAMGGSWADHPEKCTIESQQAYDAPSPTIGFRIFMDVIEE